MKAAAVRRNMEKINGFAYRCQVKDEVFWLPGRVFDAANPH
jgi:hypothetical protein